MVIKAVAGASAAVVQLVQKLYEAKQVISSQKQSKQPVSLSPPSTNNSSNESDTIDLKIEKLEEVGPTPDEDGFTY